MADSVANDSVDNAPEVQPQGQPPQSQDPEMPDTSNFSSPAPCRTAPPVARAYVPPKFGPDPSMEPPPAPKPSHATNVAPVQEPQEETPQEPEVDTSAMSPQEKRLHTLRKNNAARKAALAAAKYRVSQDIDDLPPPPAAPQQTIPQPAPVVSQPIAIPIPQAPQQIPQPIPQAPQQTQQEKDWMSKYYALKQKQELKDMMRELAAESAKTAVSELLQKAPPRQPPPMDPIVHGALAKAHADLRSQDYAMMFSKFTPHR